MKNLQEMLSDMPPSEPLSEEDVDLLSALDSAKKGVMEDYAVYQRREDGLDLGFSDWRAAKRLEVMGGGK